MSSSKHFTFTVPGDKSISHRAIMLGAIAEGVTRIDGFLNSLDCLSTIHVFKQMGVEIKRISETTIFIRGRSISGLQAPKKALDVGNSGTTIRLMMGILAGTKFSTTLVGDESIGKRPMNRVILPLQKMGAHITCKEGGYTPIRVEGKNLNGTTYSMPLSSAQVKSSVLLAGIHAKGDTKIIEKEISRDHTERMLRLFGVYCATNKKEILIKGTQEVTPAHVRVPGDISSATFLLAVGLLKPGVKVTVEDVGLNPTRTGILDVFKMMGAEVIIEETDVWGEEPVGRVTVFCEDELKGVQVGGNLIPRLIDEIPILAVVATQVIGETNIFDASELKVKESNRISAIVEELKKLGASIKEESDGMKITGPSSLQGVSCISYGDHRIAMSLLIADLITKEKVIVSDEEIVNISFPGFNKKLEEIKNSVGS